MHIHVAARDDWGLLANRGLTTVVDPMVYRSADVFIRGAKTARKKGNEQFAWDGLHANTGSLVAFFDAIVFHDALPMFDYDQTFPEDIHAGRNALLEACNQSDDVLVEVHVSHEPYKEIKDAVAPDLMSLRQQAPDSLRAEILRELSAFEYEWRPDLPAEETGDHMTEDELAFRRFLYGGLIFRGYADALKGEHYLQPKRARLTLAAALGADTAEHEDPLLKRLREIARAINKQGLAYDIPPRFPVLPYLLERYDEPRALLSGALALRQDKDVEKYREVRRKVTEMIKKGKRPLEAMRQFHDANVEARQKFKPRTAPEAGVQVGGTLSFTGPEVSTNSLRGLVGWVNDRLPRNGHYKLLMRLRGEELRIHDMGLRIEGVWRQG
jgi:hypothetical protein